jgi:hypothetical protein
MLKFVIALSINKHYLSNESKMAITLSSDSIPVNLEHGSIGVKVAQLAKEQQRAEGEMAIQLIEAALPAPQAVGNSGHNINTTA